jgi:hypothetical protein
MNKPDPQSFAEKISPEQHQQLIEWLADHTYAEVRDLVASPTPDGFGIEVSVATICRFYKANFNKITRIRQEKLSDRGAEQRLYSDSHNEHYRQNLTHGATLSLQERFYELLSRPVETIDDLKKLVYICKQINDLKIPLDPDKAIKDNILRDLAGHPLDRLLDKYGRRLFGLKPDDSTDADAMPDSEDSAPAEVIPLPEPSPDASASIESSNHSVI